MDEFVQPVVIASTENIACIQMAMTTTNLLLLCREHNALFQLGFEFEFGFGKSCRNNNGKYFEWRNK